MRTFSSVLLFSTAFTLIAVPACAQSLQPTDTVGEQVASAAASATPGSGSNSAQVATPATPNRPWSVTLDGGNYPCPLFGIMCSKDAVLQGAIAYNFGDIGIGGDTSLSDWQSIGAGGFAVENDLKAQHDRDVHLPLVGDAHLQLVVGYDLFNAKPRSFGSLNENMAEFDAEVSKTVTFAIGSVRFDVTPSARLLYYAGFGGVFKDYVATRLYVPVTAHLTDTVDVSLTYGHVFAFANTKSYNASVNQLIGGANWQATDWLSFHGSLTYAKAPRGEDVFGGLVGFTINA